MPFLLITSPSHSAGKTSLAVNLAAGLAREGNSVTLLDLGLVPGGIRKWVEGLESGNTLIEVWDEEIKEINGEMDKYFCQRIRDALGENPGRWIVADLDDRRPELFKCLGRLSGCLLAAVTLRDLRVGELPEWEKGIKEVRSGRGIDLIVPAIVNAHDWAENEPGIITMMEHYDESVIADPMPG